MDNGRAGDVEPMTKGRQKETIVPSGKTIG